MRIEHNGIDLDDVYVLIEMYYENGRRVYSAKLRAEDGSAVVKTSGRKSLLSAIAWILEQAS